MIAFANETTLVVLPKPIEINKSDMKRLRKRLINIKKLPGAENAPVVCLQGDGAYNNPLYSGAGRTPFQHATQVTGRKTLLVSKKAIRLNYPVNTPIQQQDAQQPEVKHYDGNKHSTCPIQTCGESTKKTEAPLLGVPLSYILKDLPLDKFEKEPSFQKLRGEVIQKLAWWIVGQRPTVYDLVRYVNSNKILIRNCMMMQRCQDQMRNVTAVMNWYPPA
ncbi:unnamed protein product [Mytilus edulis]|uniref:Uncharacterized protein n=1 Tax=Mytilus edulis TaxID=6550 RepID=A0A8S3VIQ1_MYTED|nr:unnamed protein product [Mytilus edulis]